MKTQNVYRPLSFLLIPMALSQMAAAAELEQFSAIVQISEVVVPSTQRNCRAANAIESTGLAIITGSGLATAGIGAFALAAVDCVRAANPYFQPPFTFNSISFKLTTSGGEEILAAYYGSAVLDPSTSLFVLNGTFEFISGTGQYRTVRGGGRVSGLEDVSGAASGQPVRGFLRLTGTIGR